MKRMEVICKEHQPYYMLILAAYLIITSSYYYLHFETPTHRVYYRMDYALNGKMNLTNVAEEFGKYNISVEIVDDGMSFSFSGGRYDNKTLHAVDGEIRFYGLDNIGYRYVVEICLNRTEFPDMSFHDALQTRGILYDSGVFIKERIYDSEGVLPKWTLNMTYESPGGL